MISTLLNTSTPITTLYAFQPIEAQHISYSYGRAINVHGNMAGDAYWTDQKSQQALSLDKEITNIGAQLQGVNSQANDINRFDIIVGHTTTNTNVHNPIRQAFYYEPQQDKMHFLGSLGGQSSVALGINDNQEIVGHAQTSAGTEQAFLYQPHTPLLKPLGTLGGKNSTATAINQHGQIVGHADINKTDTHAFSYDANGMHDIGTLGGHVSYAYDLNDDGDIVGAAQTPSGDEHAFIYQADARPCMQDIDTLGGVVSVANAINNHQQIVGYSFLANNTEAHAFLYHHNQMIDLNDLLDRQSRDAGWVLNEALDINDAGTITGIAYNTQLDIAACAFTLQIDTASASAYQRFLNRLGLKLNQTAS